jgi:primosomal protein N' (replication factor Y)
MSSEKEADVVMGCNRMMETIKSSIALLQHSMPLIVNHPVKFTHERIDGKFRYKITIKCKNNKPFRDFIRGVLKEFYRHNIATLHVFIDINGDVY